MIALSLLSQEILPVTATAAATFLPPVGLGAHLPIDAAVGDGRPSSTTLQPSRSRLAPFLGGGVSSCVLLAEAVAIVSGTWAAQSLFLVPNALERHTPTPAELDASFLSPAAIAELDLLEELQATLSVELAAALDRYFQDPAAPRAPRPMAAASEGEQMLHPLDDINGTAIVAPRWMPTP